MDLYIGPIGKNLLCIFYSKLIQRQTEKEKEIPLKVRKNKGSDQFSCDRHGEIIVRVAAADLVKKCKISLRLRTIED